MTRLHGPGPVVILAAFGACLGLAALETGARVAALIEESRQGRMARDLARVPNPAPGANVTLGQIIRRSDNPRIVYELRPRLDVVFAGARMTTSDSGHRGADVSKQKADGAFRIVGIGDSYMFGQGVSDDETYLSLLPQFLSRGGIETVNLAVPGYNTAMEAATLRQRGPDLQPDLILIEIVGNDLDLPNFLWDVVDPWRLDRSFLFDFVKSRLGRRSDDAGSTSGLGLTEAPVKKGSDGGTFRGADHVPVRYASLVGLGAFERAISDLAAFGRDAHTGVLATSHGVWFEDAMIRVLQRHDVPLLLLRPALRRRAREMGAPDYARSPLARSPTDLHPSALGHRAIAEELGAWLGEQVRP